MRSLLVALIIALTLPAAADAKRRVIAPPGNSAVNQYVEVIPTGGGSRPSSTLPSGGGRPGAPGVLSPAAERALGRGGSDGHSVAALVSATAPGPPRDAKSLRVRGPSRRGGSSGGAAKAPGPLQSDAAPGGAVNPLRTLGAALTGSSTGGLGPLLTIILAVIALGGGTLALRRRRSSV